MRHIVIVSFESKNGAFKSNEDIKLYGSEVPSIKGDTKEELIRSAIKNVIWQMDADRKAKALKQLQGHMWKSAYENGLVKGQ